MKFTFDKEWLRKPAQKEDRVEISAGTFHIDQLQPRTDEQRANIVLAFGRLVNLSRRKRGWSIERLAQSARIDVTDAVRIEHDPQYVPAPRTVYQLSHALGLPNDRMLQLSGNMIVRDTNLGEQAVRFAARSESVEKLNKEEHTALEEFVKYLSEKK